MDENKRFVIEKRIAKTMANLEKSRVMYRLSIGQLALIKKSNRNVQIAIRTQVNNSMALMAQQLRNAVLNAKTKEVLENPQSEYTKKLLSAVLELRR